MSRVVADTGIFYALLDEKDSYHQRAQSEMKKIVDTNTTVAVSRSDDYSCRCYDSSIISKNEYSYLDIRLSF